ncbi:N-recognin zinc finger protein (macronuclear) [Tetrahymena thermophila SB210]|uniref:N-recognin zinc finger protein n=1 Tax=Tetrahymena thermophila (strain SB210) TaxID=312017 RepID=Q22S60_TETTS|nr:N-recognin zinc finger protein [Tetrahymena thermophila SB210]EAR87912.2 N-recognin zinc finger protein [Tetrahymena thermophila SB210]|eukprot:XP_001008157.2 N-recognin zinc finger protein [Tetrahymena thermophila SB210]
MKRNQKLALVTIGGSAIAAAAFYYFYKRRQNIQYRYQSILKSFSQQVFTCDQFQLNNMSLKFDQLIHLATYDESDNQRTLAEKLEFQQKDQLENEGNCKKGFRQGSQFYECLDCSLIRREIQKTKKSIEEDQFYLALCEECFLTPQHKGHRYKKIEGGDTIQFKCHCGESNIMDKNCFCNNHRGFEKSKGFFEKEYLTNTKLWKGIEVFFLDMFHLLFDNMVDLIKMNENGRVIDENQKQSNNMQKKNKKDCITLEQYKHRTERINFILRLILNKFNELLEINPNIIHFIPIIFSKTLKKPIALQFKRLDKIIPDKCKWARIFKEQKEINNDLTIYEYLLLSYELVDDQNDEIVAEILRAALKVNNTFYLTLCEKFMKMFAFSCRIQNAIVKNGNYNVGFFPSLSYLVIDYISFQSTFDHLIETLGDDILGPLSYLNAYLSAKSSVISDFDEQLYILLNICFEMLRFVNQLKVLFLKYPEGIISNLYKICFALFTNNSIQINQEISKNLPENIKQKLQKMYVYSQYRQIEKIMIFAFVNICEGLLLINNEELIQKVLPLFVHYFYLGVHNSQLFLNNLAKQKIEFCSFSATIISHLPLLVALSERKMFSESVVKNFFAKNFKFKTEQDRKNFFRSLHLIASKFIIINSEPGIMSQTEVWLLMVNNNQFNQGLKSFMQALKDFLFLPYYRIYDFFTLTHSLILLADDQPFISTPESLISRYLQGCDNLKQNNDLTQLIKNYQFFYILCQNLIDSTPFYNVFSKCHDLYFPELSQNDENQKIFQQNINEIIITCINQQGDKKIYIKDVEQFSKIILDQTNLIESNIQQVCTFEDQSQNIQSQYLKIQNGYKQKLYYRHLLRVKEGLEDLCIVASDVNNQNYSILGSDFKLQNLFPYQREIYKKLILNEEFIGQIVSINLNAETKPAFFSAINHIILLAIQLIQSKSELELFSEEEITKIEKIESILKNEQLKEKYMNVNNNLSAAQKQDLQYTMKINQMISEYLNQKE